MTHAEMSDHAVHVVHDVHAGPQSAISRSRVEFLFDGVFAIAITILVLELRVPELTDHRSSTELAHGLRQYATTFGSYLLSFFVLGNFWYRHNHHYRYFRVITPVILILHFVQLAAAAFFPFCAALFGRYPFNPLAASIYIGCVLVFNLASLATWVVGWRSGAMSPELTREVYRRSLMRMARLGIFAMALLGFYVVRL